MRKNALYIALLLIVSFNLLAQNNQQHTYFTALNYYQNQQIDLAISVLETTSNCNECDEFLAELYYENNNALAAVKLYKELVESNPSDSYFMLAVIYAGMGFSNECVMYLEKHFEYKKPKSYSELMSFSEFDNVNHSYEWVSFWEIQRYSNNELQLEEAVYLVSQKDYFEALQILEELNFSARNDYINYLLAEIHFNQQNYKLTAKYLDLSLKKNDNFTNSLELKVLLSEHQQDYSSSYRTNLKLLENNPYNAEYLLKQADLTYKNDNFQEASKYVNQFLDAFPESEEAKYLNSLILIKLQDYRNSLIKLNELVESNPSKSEYFVQRADIYYLMESWQFALNDYSMALDINPNQAEVYYHFGMCAFYLNDQKRACNAWRKAAKMKNREAAKILFEVCGY